MKKVAVLVGSLRKESLSRKLAKNVATLFPDGYVTEFINIDMPVFNQDYDDEGPLPPEYTAFRRTMKDVDAVLFVTPEYNRSVPAPLKNALDVGSRPYGASVWDGKPCAIISNSPGNLSAFGANHHLRQSLVFLNMPVLSQPEAYIGGVAGLLDEHGQIHDESTLTFLRSFVNAFVGWINKHST
ncbi:MAG: NADPH-dependent FMN reductase [Clostridia bacterium]